MKRRSAPAPTSSPAASATSSSASALPALSPGWQCAVSLLLIVHVLAVFASPFALATSNSPAIRPVIAVLRPYIDFLYLDHGYAFFAPDPGRNHLVRYELEFDDGRRAVVGEFPDRDEQWPRLLYHRHFMLSETLHRAFRPSQAEPAPPGPRDASRQAERAFEREKKQWQVRHDQWRRERAQYEKLRASIAAHLQDAYKAKTVTLIRREHRLLDPEEIFEDRLQLTDAETYRILPEFPAAEVLPWTPPPIP